MSRLSAIPEGASAGGYGRLLSKRHLGKLSFWKVRSGGEEAQLMLESAELPNYQDLRKVPLGSHISFMGTMVRTNSGDRAVKLCLASVEAVCTRPQHDVLSDKRPYASRGSDLMVNTPALQALARISTATAAIRAELRAQGFREFSTGVLQEQAEAGQAEVFTTKCRANGKQYSLTLTSEIKLRHLLAAGFDAVYEVLQSFRNEGIDAMHSPEFTLLEAYRVGADYRDMMQVAERLVLRALAEAHADFPLPEAQRGMIEAWSAKPFDRVCFSDLSKEVLKMEAADLSAESLAARFPGQFTPNMTTFTWVFKLINKVFAPTLSRPTFIMEPPSGISPFVKASPGREAVSERATLIIDGLDVADIYTDETDPELLRAALLAQAERTGRAPSEALLNLIELGLPLSAGMGMSLTRLGLLLRGDLPLTVKGTMLFPIY